VRQLEPADLSKGDEEDDKVGDDAKEVAGDDDDDGVGDAAALVEDNGSVV
jgi:hypothetical protein